MMQLIYSDASPYARAARMVVIEASAASSIELVALHPFDNPPALIDANPLAKVPCLLRPPQTPIYDSEVICQFIDAEFNYGRLWEPLKHDWQRRTQFSLVKGLIDLAVALRQEAMREAEGSRSEFWSSRFTQGIERGLLEVVTGIDGFLSDFSMQTLYLLCLLDYLTFRHPQIKWQQHIKLAEFADQHATRASAKQTFPA